MKTMQMVIMDNDVGGTVFVGKNEIRLVFSNKVRHRIRIDTKELLKRLEKKTEDEWETDDFIIEPRYCCPDGCMLIIITIKNSGYDNDCASVFYCDMVGALTDIERLEMAY